MLDAHGPTDRTMDKNARGTTSRTSQQGHGPNIAVGGAQWSAVKVSVRAVMCGASADIATATREIRAPPRAAVCGAPHHALLHQLKKPMAAQSQPGAVPGRHCLLAGSRPGQQWDGVCCRPELRAQHSCALAPA
ncbi:uncharacterized protein LOC114361237 [Ostrinia furnacalis]|uniref:uncharacterized protein LOC114361237 n=1 Tax=Ostrinia furnacalis TaxID=93504 RepID=UPI00103EED8A|nr:uncharacterized protein LOC114361237 [Ostrinia furnacalis]